MLYITKRLGKIIVTIDEASKVEELHPGLLSILFRHLPSIRFVLIDQRPLNYLLDMEGSCIVLKFQV